MRDPTRGGIATTLNEIAVTAFQELELPHGFYALCGNLNIETLGHRDCGTNNALMAVVDFNIGNQCLVQYETVDESTIDGLEGNVPGAEVIQRQPHTELAKSSQDIVLDLALLQIIAIANLEFDAAWIK